MEIKIWSKCQIQQVNHDSNNNSNNNNKMIKHGEAERIIENDKNHKDYGKEWIWYNEDTRKRQQQMKMTFVNEAMHSNIDKSMQ